MIYFLQDNTRNHIKISFTEGDDAEVRRKALQTGNSSPLVVLFTMDGTRADESKLHEQFTSARECGEWFRPTPELLQFILHESDFKAFASGHNSGVEHVRAIRKSQETGKATIGSSWPVQIYLAGKSAKTAGDTQLLMLFGMHYPTSSLARLTASRSPSGRSSLDRFLASIIMLGLSSPVVTTVVFMATTATV